MSCTHDINERETAVTADGYCPLCMSAEIDRLKAELNEADDLLQVAYYAHQKMGLEGEGNRGHSHEVRVFAMHFSQPEKPKTPEHVILSGDGRYWKFRLRDRPDFYQRMVDRIYEGAR